MIRVLYLTRNGLLEPLGQSQIWPYLRGLSQYHTITLITFEKPGDRSSSSSMLRMHNLCLSYGIRWIPLKFRASPRPLAPALAIPHLALVAIWQWRRRDRPQLIHARSYVPAAIALILHHLSGVPFIFDMRALWPEELIASGYLRRDSFLHSSLKLLELLLLKEASSVVSLTYSAVAYLKRKHHKALEFQRFSVIPTCADLLRFHPVDTIQKDPLVIGCIGTMLSGWFLIDWLRSFLEAFIRVGPPARFEFISQDPHDEILTALRPDPSWADLVVIASATPEQMPQILRMHSASMMFFTSGLSKLGSSPTRMAEVLGSGCPVVANAGVGDLDQIITRHRVGVLARGQGISEMESCVMELVYIMNEPDLQARCRHVAEQLFSLESGIAAYHRLYQDSNL